MLMWRSAGIGADGYLILLRLCDEDIGVKKQISLHNHLTAEAVLTSGGTLTGGAEAQPTESCVSQLGSMGCSLLGCFSVVLSAASQQEGCGFKVFTCWGQADVMQISDANMCLKFAQRMKFEAVLQRGKTRVRCKNK